MGARTRFTSTNAPYVSNYFTDPPSVTLYHGKKIPYLCVNVLNPCSKMIECSPVYMINCIKLQLGVCSVTCQQYFGFVVVVQSPKICKCPLIVQCSNVPVTRAVNLKKI